MVFLAQQRSYDGGATTAKVLAQRLLQPKWGKAVPGLAHLVWHEHCADPTVLARQVFQSGRSARNCGLPQILL
jgi:hypothetical protein